MSFPIEFAPHIPYEGEEYLIFPPGWGKVESEEHWTYFFLWWIKSQGENKITKETLDRDFTEYYNGLVSRNIVARKIDSAKIVPSVARFEPGTEPNVAFTGTIDMLDYHTQKPIRLFIEIGMRYCIAQDRWALFVFISPKSKSHPIWSKLKSIETGFQCAK